jgi:hypothetical protein
LDEALADKTAGDGTMTNILYVEKERVLKETRRSVNASHPKLVDRYDVEKERASKKAFATNEARLQALAAAERERRSASAKAEMTKKAGAKKGALPISAPEDVAVPIPPSRHVTFAASRPSSSRPPSARPTSSASTAASGEPEEKVCTVVKVHPDGMVDLMLSSGQIAERIDPTKLQRAGIPPLPGGTEDEPPEPPSTAASTTSRPPTAPNASPNAEQAKPAVALGGLDELQFEQLTMGARRGGRRTVGAARAAHSEIASLLSWD